MMIRARKDWEHLPRREACFSGKNLNTVNKKGKYQKGIPAAIMYGCYCLQMTVPICDG